MDDGDDLLDDDVCILTINSTELLIQPKHMLDKLFENIFLFYSHQDVHDDDYYFLTRFAVIVTVD